MFAQNTGGATRLTCQSIITLYMFNNYVNASLREVNDYSRTIAVRLLGGMCKEEKVRARLGADSKLGNLNLGIQGTFPSM